MKVQPRQIEAFLASIQTFESATLPSLSYLAFRQQGGWQLFRVRLNFNLANYNREPFHIRTESIRAGLLIVEDGAAGAKKLIQSVTDGFLVIEGERMNFPPQLGGGYSATHVPLLPEGAERQCRLSLLQIRGSDQAGYHGHALFDWELRASDTPFDGVAELLATLNIANLPDQTSLFEAMVFQMAVIDGDSRIEGTQATIGLAIAPTLERERASLGYRVLSGGEVVARAQISGCELRWSTEDAREIGWIELTVPPASVVQAFACYAGVAYHHWWLQDPKLSQNPRRAAFAKVDPDLAVLTSFLSGQQKQARDLEFAVSWLLWMLGFNPAHLGANQKMSDNVDILVATPLGHFAVVECTTGVLKSGHKLSLLVERAEGLRQALRLSNSQHLRVLPLMVTTLSENEVQAELEDARKAGIVVITRDQIPELAARTLLLPNADRSYSEAEQSLRDSA